jgi:hypothetical protein
VNDRDEKNYLGELDGQLVIISEWNHSAEPVRVKQHWPIWPDGWTIESAREAGLLGCPAHYGRNGYSISIRETSARWVGEHTFFRLKNGGETVSLRNDKTPIPPPQTGLTTRWKDGRWEKCHGKRGWIPA